MEGVGGSWEGPVRYDICFDTGMDEPESEGVSVSVDGCRLAYAGSPECGSRNEVSASVSHTSSRSTQG